MSPASSYRATFIALAMALAVPLHSARAQEAFDARGAVHVRDQYMVDLDTLHAKIVALAIALPEDTYTWRPAPGVRSVSETLMHIAHEWYYYVPTSVGGIAPANFGPPKAAETRLGLVTKKSEVLDELAKSWSHGRAQVGAVDAAHLTGEYKPWGMPIDQAALVMAGDLHEHLGQLIAYARMNGVKPPWTK